MNISVHVYVDSVCMYVIVQCVYIYKYMYMKKRKEKREDDCRK